MSRVRPTLKDIAERSGFALRTVKKVMSGDPSVREKNREAILRVAEELNYAPNRAASALGKQKFIRLAVVYSRFTDLYFPDIDRGFQQCISELFDYGLVLEFHITTSADPAQQYQVLESLLPRNDIDGVILQPLNPTLLDGAINALVESGKPVGIFGTDAPNSKRLFCVSCDGYRAGRIAGQLMEREVKHPGKIYVFNSSHEQTQMVSRQQGFLDRIREHNSDLEIVVPYLENPAEYYETLRHLLVTEQVDGIYCTDAHVIYAGQALKDLKRTDIPLIGYDVSDSSTSLMREDYISVILDQRPEIYSYLSVKLLFDFLADKKLPDPIQHTPLYILTSECLDNF